MRFSSTHIGILLLMLAVALAAGIPALFAEEATGGKTSHSPDAEPDYGVVFPAEEIREIFLSVSPESWQEMQDDMEEQYGEFGNASTHGPGAGRGEGQMPIPPFPGGEEPGVPPGRPEPGFPSHDDPVYVPVTVTFQGETFEHAGLRYKGVNSLMTAWSAGVSKISLKVDMDRYEDEFPETEDQTFFGFSELNLQSGASDETAIREKIVPEIFRDAGVVAPMTAFYRVYLDHGEGYEYAGLYTLAEAVDDTVIETQYTNGSGNLYKPEGEGATFAQGSLDLSAFEKKTNEDEKDYSDVEEVYAALHAETRTTSPETWRTELETALNVRQFLTWLATNTLIGNWDTYGGNSRNYYLYADPTTGNLSWIPWDNNFALTEGHGMIHGTGGESPSMNRTMPTGGGPGGSVSLGMENVTDHWPLIRYLMDDPEYHRMYQEILADVAEKAFDPGELGEKIDRYQTLIASSVTGPDGEREGWTYVPDAAAFNAAFTAMKAHIRSSHDRALTYLSTAGI